VDAILGELQVGPARPGRRIAAGVVVVEASVDAGARRRQLDAVVEHGLFPPRWDLQRQLERDRGAGREVDRRMAAVIDVDGLLLTAPIGRRRSDQSATGDDIAYEEWPRIGQIADIGDLDLEPAGAAGLA